MEREYKVRPHPQDVQKHAARVHLRPATFNELGFTRGNLCTIATKGGIKRDAVLWQASGPNDIGKNVALLSRFMLDAVGLKLGDEIRLTPGGPVPDAGAVVMRETTLEGGSLGDLEELRWQHFLEHKLEVAEYVVPGTLFEDLMLRGSRRSFVVETVNGSSEGVGKFASCTSVEFSSGETNGVAGRLHVDALPALRKQTYELNRFFGHYGVDMSNWGRPLASCGVIVHGSHGTGKSLLLDRVAATGWGRVIRITSRDKPSTIQDHFDSSLQLRTSTIILIDDIDEMIGDGVTNRSSFIRHIRLGLDALAARTRKQKQRPNVVVVASCLDFWNDIPYELRKPGRFDKQIGLTAPDATGREEIIQSLINPLSDIEDKYKTELAHRTHAYTGEDLERVIDRATDAWSERIENGSPSSPYIWDDFRKGLQEVRPTALHDINLKPPTVKWSDIGGYEDVKTALQSVLKPFRNEQGIKQQAKKGILLYGPPGCSKTMTAQAFATECKASFFVVKGSELLNMYVGETERSIRNIFKRARETSPSVIFLDEIDSLAGARAGLGGGGGTVGSGGVQATATLLNEMDGFEESGDVFVLAATNRPDSLDPALIRPGRFDQLIYVPLPDLQAREAIVAARARKLNLPGDIDAAVLARDMEGYSGAEIATICGTAFVNQSSVAPGTAMEILQAAIRGTPRRTSKQLLDYFEKWQQSFA
ncbi:AAA-domain-containing protein [Xylariaceae sp. FL0804]|nr:AAA-domain-containing protein [Xylariaceae sp. FL0804]